MVRLTRIYTRSGDKGSTALGNGRRVRKHEIRVAAYGAVDEANAAIGVALLSLKEAALQDSVAMLERIQNDLFDLGADLCRPLEEGKPALRMSEAQSARLEQEIDRMNAELQPLSSFVLPGGTLAAAHLHLARAIVRRAERDIVALADTEPVNPLALRYANRLSDHLFVLARFLNERGGKDILWVPGAHRQDSA
jgi:cob(I)alamin adenosyltransferase